MKWRVWHNRFNVPFMCMYFSSMGTYTPLGCCSYFVLRNPPKSSTTVTRKSPDIRSRVSYDRREGVEISTFLRIKRQSCSLDRLIVCPTRPRCSTRWRKSFTIPSPHLSQSSIADDLLPTTHQCCCHLLMVDRIAFASCSHVPDVNLARFFSFLCTNRGLCYIVFPAWTAASVFAGHDSKIVFRSAEILGYPATFQYKEVIACKVSL